ncbi:hypothetical protein BDP27DRAFT_1342517 [Rhodocollybia butyracea]|uniref:Thiamine-binding protein domain-containing protein n=1 Tax=Rhodocollybia butyracea TaxID=206335 RepID=A0A9P5TY73_9AGAR|nr:hypothetical protein BDP27DRAFT_1342517 [Rhodocollybia butyracea]
MPEDLFLPYPMGTAEPSVAGYIAECQRILEKSGLQYKAQGPWSEVSKAIHDCHLAVHGQGAPALPRTSVSVHAQIGKLHRGQERRKVKRVEEILAK